MSVRKNEQIVLKMNKILEYAVFNAKFDELDTQELTTALYYTLHLLSKELDPNKLSRLKKVEAELREKLE
ncbi:hypothetical protein [Pontibacter sp. SGAir0037]|uniref:hypothetical protein n=1 Tax=Pontibacter sp. SGAir0037 TaxID=2571030 RepID=UPI0010F60D6C|nr:hypothetical protein [Pontibacter sp. SGAir0037]